MTHEKSKKILIFLGLFLGISMTDLKSGSLQDNGGKADLSAAENTTIAPIALATIAYPEKDSKHHLSIYKSRIQSLASWDLEVFFKNHPDEGGIPNTEFVLLESSSGELGNGKALFLSYEYDNPALPMTIWGADVVWHAEKGKAFLVLMKSKSIYVEIRVYQINPDNAIATHPIELDPKKYDEWPKASEPITEIKRSIEDEHSCGVGSIKAQLENNKLLIYAEREHKSCPSIQFTFDLKTKVWTDKCPPGTKALPLKE